MSGGAGSARETGQTHAEVLRAYIEGNGYQIVVMSDGHRSAVPIENEPALAALDVLLAELETQRQRADQADREAAEADAQLVKEYAIEAELEAALVAARQERDSFERALNAATRLWPQCDVVEAELAAVRQRETQLREALAQIKAASFITHAWEIADTVLADTSPPQCTCGHPRARHAGAGFCVLKDCPCVKFTAATSPPEGCPNGPDEYGTWPCEPLDLHDGRGECQTCGRVANWADTSSPPTLSEPEKSRPEPDAQPLTAGVAQAALESGCSGSLSVRDTSPPEPEEAQEPCEFCGDGPCIANCEESQEAP